MAPERVASLTSIMSTTGDPDVGQPRPEVLPTLLGSSGEDRSHLLLNADATAGRVGFA